MRRRQGIGAVLALSVACAAPAALAQGVAPETVGRSLALPGPGADRVWVSDVVLRRSALFDAGSGAMLGMLSGGLGLIGPAVARDAREIYLAETHYARTTRGERTDVVTVYDGQTLLPLAEVAIPAKRAEHYSGVAASTLTDDERFLVVFNQDPGQSVSVVDVAARRFAGEIPTPGCGLVFAAGPRRFAMPCGDGTLLWIELDAEGREAARGRSERFFDPQADPVTEKAARLGKAWHFVSYAGRLHAVDFGGGTPRFAEPWPLIDAADAAAGWRIGGAQHLAAHAPSGRLFALVHQGGEWSHRDPGTEVWVYDAEAHARVGRIALRSPSGLFLSELLTMGDAGAAARALAWLVRGVAPHTGVDRIAITGGGRPLLLAASTLPPSLAVYDATSGAHLRDVSEVGLAVGLLVTP